MYNNDLLLYICHLIEDHNLGVILSRLDDRHFRSRYLPQKKLIIVNTNWWNPPEVPFMAAHELGHCINGDTGVMYYAHDYDCKNMMALTETKTQSRKIKLNYMD